MPLPQPFQYQRGNRALAALILWCLTAGVTRLVYELYGLSSEEIKIVEGEKGISVGQPLSHRPG